MKTLLTWLVVVLAGPAAAQSHEWSFAGSLYAWIPGISNSIETAQGTVDIDTSGSDALAALDMAFMGAFELRNGRWGLIGDLIYSDLSSSVDAPLGVLFSSGEVETKLTALTGYALYRVYEDPRVAVDLGGGFRSFGVELDLTLEPGDLEGQQANLDSNWIDPLVAGRAIVPFNDKWFATALADAGGFGGGGNSTWQALATVGYRFSERWSTQIGYRYLNIEKEISGRDVAMDLYGPLIGFTARF